MPPSGKETSGLAHIEDDLLAEGPVALFKRWRQEAEAAKIIKPESGVISTCTKDGKISMRTVCWRLTDNGRFVFLTDNNSKKCRELEENPRAAVAFLWIYPNSKGEKLARQIRIEGIVKPVARSTVQEIFDKMLPHYTLRAQLCKQGSPVDVQELRQRYNDLKNRQDAGEVFSMPDHQVGYELFPEIMEFYEDEASKVGDRVLFTRLDTAEEEDAPVCEHFQKPNLWHSYHISA